MESRVYLEFKYQISFFWEIWKIVIFILFLLFLYTLYLFSFKGDNDSNFFNSLTLLVDFFFFIDIVFKILKLVFNMREMSISNMNIIIFLEILTVFPFFLIKNLKQLYLIKLTRIIFIWQTIPDMKHALRKVLCLFTSRC